MKLRWHYSRVAVTSQMLIEQREMGESMMECKRRLEKRTPLTLQYCEGPLEEWKDVPVVCSLSYPSTGEPREIEE